MTVLAGCATVPPGTEINDPYEAQNRAVHSFNKGFDRTLFGDGTKNGVIPSVPAPVARGLSNVASNLAAPSNAVNGLLQGRPETVVANTFRFLINSTVGLGGLFDPAGAIGLAKIDTDFGETLHVWGAQEGAYLELPVLGPSTQRDFAGKIVDFVIDPVNNAISAPESTYVTAARVGARIGDRQRYASEYEAILYGSADSYAQERILYLQNRRFKLGEEEKTFDPYGDPYAQ